MSDRCHLPAALRLSLLPHFLGAQGPQGDPCTHKPRQHFAGSWPFGPLMSEARQSQYSLRRNSLRRECISRSCRKPGVTADHCAEEKFQWKEPRSTGV